MKFSLYILAAFAVTISATPGQYSGGSQAQDQGGYQAAKPPCTKSSESGYSAAQPTNNYDSVPPVYTPVGDVTPANNNYNAPPVYTPVSDVAPTQANNNIYDSPPVSKPCAQSSPTQVYEQQQQQHHQASPTVQDTVPNGTGAVNSEASIPTTSFDQYKQQARGSNGNVESFSQQFSAAATNPSRASLVAMCLVIGAGLLVM